MRFFNGNKSHKISLIGFMNGLQKLADEDGTTLSIGANGEKSKVVIKPRKKSKKRK